MGFLVQSWCFYGISISWRPHWVSVAASPWLPVGILEVIPDWSKYLADLLCCIYCQSLKPHNWGGFGAAFPCCTCCFLSFILLFPEPKLWGVTLEFNLAIQCRFRFKIQTILKIPLLPFFLIPSRLPFAMHQLNVGFFSSFKEPNLLPWLSKPISRLRGERMPFAEGSFLRVHVPAHFPFIWIYPVDRVSTLPGNTAILPNLCHSSRCG